MKIAQFYSFYPKLYYINFQINSNFKKVSTLRGNCRFGSIPSKNLFKNAPVSVIIVWTVKTTSDFFLQ